MLMQPQADLVSFRQLNEADIVDHGTKALADRPAMTAGYNQLDRRTFVAKQPWLRRNCEGQRLCV